MEDRTDHALSYDLETFEWPGLKNSRVPIQFFKMATSVADDKTQFFIFYLHIDYYIIISITFN